MNPNILAFGASNSSQSINRTFAHWAAGQITGAELNLLDIRELELPIFGVDLEQEIGQPENALRFKQMIRESHGIVLSLAEHNGGYSAFFKNLYDWTSRISKAIWENKPLLVLSTSPGKRGGKSSLEFALSTFPHQGAGAIQSFSLPSFGEHFNVESGITDAALDQAFRKALVGFETDVQAAMAAVQS